MAVRLAPPADRRAVLAAGLAGAGLRRDRGGDLQHRRLARLVRRPGVPDAGALPGAVAHARRAVAPLAGRTTPSPGPNLDDLHEIGPVLRPPPARRSTTAGTTSRRSSGSSASTRRRSRSRRSLPGRWRAATAYPHPATRGSGDCAFGEPRTLGVRRTTRDGIDRFRHRPDDRHARGAVVGRRRRAQRPGPRPAPRRGRRPDLHLRAARRRRSRSSACRRSSSTSRSTRRSRRCPSGCPTSPRTARSPWSAPGS